MAIRREQIIVWVEAARAGDRAALGHLVRQFQDAVAAVVLARIGAGPDVEDLTQEAFVAAYRQLGQLRDSARFGPWVCSIGRNLALRWLRGRHPVSELPPDLPAPQPPKRDELVDRVMAAVARLPERLREPLTMFYINGYDTGEVASLLDLPPGTVRRRLHEARDQLRQYLEVTMREHIRQNAPASGLAQSVLDRIAAVRVLAWGSDATGQCLLVTDVGGRSFVMMVGNREALALAEALGQRAPSPQPPLYDLMLAAIQHFGLVLRAVRISDLRDGTFYARVDVGTPAGDISLDARPSDAINLAVRGKVELQVAREVTRQACPDFDHPRPPEEVVRMAAGGSSLESLEELWVHVRAHPEDQDARVRLAWLLVRTNMHASYKWPMPLLPEQMAQRATEHLGEARGLLTEALAVLPAGSRRQEALLCLGMVEYLEGNWVEAAAAFDQHGGPWDEMAWAMPFHYATALHRSGRDAEALDRVAEALAAIDRMYGTDPGRSARLVARATLADLAVASLGDLRRDPRYRSLFGAIEQPYLVRGWVMGPPFEYGQAFSLGQDGLVLGSGPDTDVAAADPSVEARHARVRPEGQGWILEDLGSKAGTWQNQRLTGPELLHSGWPFRIGEKPTKSTYFMFLNLAEVLDKDVRHDARAFFVDVAGEQPWFRPVPLAETFRKTRGSDQAAQGKDQGPLSRDLQTGDVAPRVDGWPVLWAVARVQLGGDDVLTLYGATEGHVAALGFPGERKAALAELLQRKPPVRPTTEHLVVAFLKAGGLACKGVVIGPTDERGRRVARMLIAREGPGIWLDASPVDALGVAMAMESEPLVWACPAN